jgi:succinyl-diaminopimelate desuccinylase
VSIASESHQEAALADHVERRDNVVGRSAGTGERVLLAGHLDTVPASGNAVPVVDGDILHGLGAADMKGGLAVMLHLAETVDRPTRSVTYVFYAAEEVARADNGLLALDAARPDLLAADVAILGEPTGAIIEAGCQGVLKARVTLGGRRAHTARPWMGVNAVHRLAPLLATVASAPLRRPVLDGCAYREALSVVAVEGGVAGNVVPDRASVVVSHRFAPDRSDVEAEAWLRGLLDGHLDPDLGDNLEVIDRAPAAAPGLTHPILATLQQSIGVPPRAKLGWTDIAFFAGRGIPAVNFGPGDPELAHTPEERVERGDLDAAHRVLVELLTNP